MSDSSQVVLDPPLARSKQPPGLETPSVAAFDSVEPGLSGSPPRPAWIEIDLKRLQRNFDLINQDKPKGLRVISVVKDEAYGHGALQVARTSLDCGASFLALSTLAVSYTHLTLPTSDLV